MRILITGGTGLIGKELCRLLASERHEIIVLSRNPKAHEMTMPVTARPDIIKLHQWDPSTTEGWGHLIDEVDAVINLAGTGIADARWSAARKTEIRNSRLQAGNILTEAIRDAKNKPKVFIQGSAVGFYGGAQGDTVIDEMGDLGNDFLAKVCFDWEISTAPIEKMGVRRVILRTGVVLSNDGGAFPKMVMPFQYYVGGPLGSGQQWLPWIHWKDEVRAIHFLLTNEEASGVFNLSAPNPLNNKDFSNLLGNVMGRPAAMAAPAIAMQIVLGEMSTLVLDGQRVVPSRLQELGFTFDYEEAEDALRELLDKPEEVYAAIDSAVTDSVATESAQTNSTVEDKSSAEQATEVASEENAAEASKESLEKQVA